MTRRELICQFKLDEGRMSPRAYVVLNLTE